MPILTVENTGAPDFFPGVPVPLTRCFSIPDDVGAKDFCPLRKIFRPYL